jgi:hypothetical protein
MRDLVAVKLKPVVHFREFPFGISTDPRMTEFMAERPGANQDKVLEYLRSGHVLALTRGADLPAALVLHAAAQQWKVSRVLDKSCRYVWSCF